MAKAAPAPKQYFFVSHRDVTVTSLQGYSIFFEKGVPTHAPRAIHSEVMEKGVMPCDEQGNPLDEPAAAAVVAPEQPRVMVAPEDGHEREEAILEAIKTIVKRNNSKDFNAGGVPSAGSLTAALGWKVDTTEVRAIWVKHKPKVVKGEGAGD